MRNEDGDEERGIFIQRGRLDVGAMKPGDRKELRFEFKVKESLRAETTPINITVLDGDLREATSEKYDLRIASQGPVLRTTRLTAKQGGEIRLRGTAADNAPAFALADGPITADAMIDGWYRVPLERKVYGWVPMGEVAAADGPAAANQTRRAPFKGPPRITLSQRGVDVETQQDALTLSGEALADEGVQDLLIFVNNRKVFFKSAGSNKGDKGPMRFSARVPLEEGVNRITVVAREDEELSSRETLIVHRNGQTAVP
jgi:carboxyl-terminal processing protease